MCSFNYLWELDHNVITLSYLLDGYRFQLKTYSLLNNNNSILNKLYYNNSEGFKSYEKINYS